MTIKVPPTPPSHLPPPLPMKQLEHHNSLVIPCINVRVHTPKYGCGINHFDLIDLKTAGVYRICHSGKTYVHENKVLKIFRKSHLL
jgi:hypothetical protein